MTELAQITARPVRCPPTPPPNVQEIAWSNSSRYPRSDRYLKYGCCECHTSVWQLNLSLVRYAGKVRFDMILIRHKETLFAFGNAVLRTLSMRLKAPSGGGGLRGGIVSSGRGRMECCCIIALLWRALMRCDVSDLSGTDGSPLSERGLIKGRIALQ